MDIMLRKRGFAASGLQDSEARISQMVRYGSTRKAFILHDEDGDGQFCRYFQNTSPFARCRR